MKGLLTYAVIVVTIRTTVPSVYFAVSPIDGNEQFYLRIKNSRSFENRNQEETPAVKTEICETIIGSPLFRTRHQCETSLDPQAVMEELKQNYSRIHQQAKSSSNAYRAQNIHVTGRIVEERVFFCLARQRHSRNINQYLVSAEYILEQDEARKVKGRFVFLSDKVIALAEEPAHVEDTDRAKVEESFWKTIYVGWQAKWRSDDVLCKLSSFQKIRLCNSILNSDVYRKNVKFVPEMKNIEPQCALQEVRFDFEQVAERDKGANAEDIYKPVGPVLEWMVPCKVEYVKTNENIMRYILRGAQNHDNRRFYVGMVHPEDNATYLESIIGVKQEAKQQNTQKQQTDDEEEDDEEEGPQRGGGNPFEEIFSVFM